MAGTYINASPPATGKMIVTRLRPLSLVSFVILCVVSGGTLEAQTLTRGALEGVIAGSDGIPLPAANVQLRQRETGRSWTAELARDGRFEFDLLTAGDYDLFAEQIGFRPLLIQSIPVVDGERSTVSVSLTIELIPSRADTVRFQDMGAPYGLFASNRYDRAALLRLPSDERGLGELSGWSAASEEGFGMQGLPGFLSTVMVGGLRTSPIRSPGGSAGRFAFSHFPQSELASVEIIPNPADAEFPATAGGLFRTDTRRGTSRLVVEGIARIGDSLDGGSSAVIESPFEETDARVGIAVRGPLASNGGAFSFGLEGWRARPSVVESDAAEAIGSQVAAVGLETYGYEVPSLTETLQSEVLTAFSRFDWDLSDSHSLTLRANFASFPDAGELTGGPLDQWGGNRFDGMQMVTAGELVSKLGEGLDQSLRIGVENSDHTYSGSGPTSTILGNGAGYTLNGGETGKFEDVTFRASETVNYRFKGHRLKGGLEISSASSEHSYDRGSRGEYFFGSLERFGAGEGIYSRTAGPADADFSINSLGIFLQDSWRAGPGLEITAGVRGDVQTLPRDQISPNPGWSQLVGLDSIGFESRTFRLSPNASLRWRPGGTSAWEVDGSYRMVSGPADASLLSRFLAYDEGVAVSRGVGSFNSWPEDPDLGLTTSAGTRLSLIAPGFESPLTSQASAELSRRIGVTGVLRFAGAYRHTRNLGRVHDLNLIGGSVAEDQFGRPLYGWLERANGFIQAAPGSNRLFSGFEEVLSLDSDGWSEYVGGSVSLERKAPVGWNLSATYAFSRTRDNWLLSDDGMPLLNPFPDEPGEEPWAEGVSNFDVPHRAFVSLFGPLLPRIGFGATYRLRSGLPFTPRFGPELDANGDGRRGNDPAFIDTQMAGMDALLGEWECLRDESGGIATRNSCRGPIEHALDARLNLVVARPGGSELSIVIDGLNLLATRRDILDSALYSVDEATPLLVDRSAGTTVLPLSINPRFGEPISSYSPARLLRIAVRLSN